MIRRILVSLLGSFQWQPPGWLAGLGRLLLRHRRWVAAALVAIVAVTGGWVWVCSLPQPVTVQATVESPGVSPWDSDGIHPQPLRIRFDGSVAPLEQLDHRIQLTMSGDPRSAVAIAGKEGRPVPKGIRMEPEIAGKWFWESDSTLCFQPTGDWPAATKYSVTLDRGVVAPHIRLTSYRYDWKTPDFSASVREIAFYQNPKDLSVKQIVATVDLSHQADEASLAAHAEFFMLGRRTKEPLDVHYDSLHRVAYLRSKPLVLPTHEDFVKLTLSKGMRTVQGGATTRDAVEAKCNVPDIYSFFRISDSGAGIVMNDDGDPEQVLTVSTTCAIKSADLAKALSIRILPPHKPDADGTPRRWEGPREINTDALANSRTVAFETLPTRDSVTTEHAFRFRMPEDGQLYVRVAQGVTAPGDFVLGSDYDALLDVPKPLPSVAFESEGAVLALTGEKKLPVKSRNVPAIEFQIARVATSQINHLVSQTCGNFGSPEFRNWCFDEENISRLSTERQMLAGVGPFAENVTAFDFAPRLAVPSDGGSERGLFFLTATGWDPKTKKHIDGAGDTRFLLVTDLGLIVKENADGSRDLFVGSIKDGHPLSGVQASILGKNGVPLAQATTDENGHTKFPSVEGDKRESEPVAFVARLGEDVAFLPYDRADRKLDFSRFDIGGDEVRSGAELDAFLFTERGVYRPGDTIHLGSIVKRRDWAAVPAGLPLEMEVVDARSRVVLVKRVATPADGFGEFEYATEPASPTGSWTFNLYLIHDKERARLLGSANVLVKEFLPDRLKISAELNHPVVKGWIAPDDLKATVSLQNLYGAPAADRKVTARLDLSPCGFSFDAWPGYRFDNPLRDRWTSSDLRTFTLPDQTTDEAGKTTFDLDLER
ncbi:MAG: MG2 domain-containing protein, partial [Chthoniobacterales bacterium]